MGEYIATLWLQHQLMVSTFAAAIALILTYLLFHERLSFWLMDRSYTFPLIGKIARFGREPPTYANEPGWLNAERTLCGDYRNYIAPIPEEQFDNYNLYMKKAYDHGRKPLPGWVVALLSVLLIAEGLGFSYLLATWMAREGSQYIQTWLMVAIVLVLCVVLMWIMHSTGHQLFRTNLLRSCFREFREERGASFHSQPIALNQDQTCDDGDAHYVCCANRVIRRPGDRGAYWWAVLAVVAMVVIASASTWMRMSNLRHEQIAAVAVTSSGNPFSATGDALPSEITAPQQDADKKALQEEQGATRSEGLAAFGMLAFIFVITQIVAISAGYKYGFAGNESEDAFKGTGGFPDYESYSSWFNDRVRVAEARLEALQHTIKDKARHPIDLTKSFTDYLNENPVGSAGRKRNGPNTAPAKPVTQPVQNGAAQPASVTSTNGSSGQSGSGAGGSPGVALDARIVAALERLEESPDREARMTIMRSLPSDLADGVAAELEKRKNAETAKREGRWNDLL